MALTVSAVHAGFTTPAAAQRQLPDDGNRDQWAMTSQTLRSDPEPSSDTYDQNLPTLPQRSFYTLALLIAILWSVSWCLINSEFVLRSLRLWNPAELRFENYSRFVDARDPPASFRNSLIETSSRYENGWLFVGQQSLYSRKPISVDPKKSYRLSFDIRSVSDGAKNQGSVIYAGIVCLDENGNIIANESGITHLFKAAYHQMIGRADGKKHIAADFNGALAANGNMPAATRSIRIALELNPGDPTAGAIISNVSFRRN